MDSSVELTVYSNLFYGAVGVNPDLDSLAVTLNDGLETAFDLSNHVLMTFNDLSVAAVVQNGQFFIFDSHGRDAQGQICEHGTSILVHFESFNDLVAYLLKVYNAQMFNLSPVQFVTQVSGQNTNDINVNSKNVQADDISRMDDDDTWHGKACDNGLTGMSLANSSTNDNTINGTNIDTRISCGDNHEGMSMETEYSLCHPTVITVEYDDLRRAMNPFIDYSYHNRHHSMASVIHDHGYCQNASSNSKFCGEHYSPHEEYIQQNLNQYCSMCHRLLFKDKCIFKIVDGIEKCFCYTCN